MQYRQLGSSALRVSEISLGSWLTYGVGVAREPAVVCVRRALEVLRAVQRLKPLAHEAGVSMSQFALAWVLREPNVASAIVGASSPQQLDENAAASGLHIDAQLFVAADAAVASVVRAQ